MNTEIKHCQNCRSSFIIDASDFDFYRKIDVPPPTFCPECRFVRRLIMRNERSLYKRKCDMCGEDKIMVFPPDSPFKVYCFSCWWSDRWDGIKYARDYDFSQPFFKQLNELFRTVPRVGIIQQGFIVNSEYTNRVSDLKDCYLIFASANNENCYYGTSFWDSKDSMDCYNAHKCEKCYECLDIFNCNNVRYAKECNNCSNSAFMINCRNSDSCFGCVNLRNKSYCLWNEQCTKEEYLDKIKKYDLGDRLVVAELRKRLRELSDKFIVPALVEYHGNNVSGNWIEECKDVRIAFNCEKVENGKYLMGVMEAKDVMDYTYWGKSSELVYQTSSVGRQCSDVLFCNESWDQLIRARYSMNCHSTSDVFGCIGLRKKQCCILNKQYSKEEYEAMVQKIIEHMNAVPYKLPSFAEAMADKHGANPSTDSTRSLQAGSGQGGKSQIVYRYGEFFPPEIAAFPYNETIAQEYFPKTKTEAESCGYAWSEPAVKNHNTTLDEGGIPYSISEVKDTILDGIISCAHQGECADQCTAAFKITANELMVYRSAKIPIPTMCPNCRHYERLRDRPPMKLWSRVCCCTGKTSQNGIYQNVSVHFHGEVPCPNEFETAYSSERAKMVYCLECYRSEVA